MLLFAVELLLALKIPTQARGVWHGQLKSAYVLVQVITRVTTKLATLPVVVWEDFPAIALKAKQSKGGL